MVAVIAIVAPQLPWYSLDAREFAWRQHGVFFRWANEAVERVGARLLPNETIFSWSDEAWIYSKLNRGAPGPTLWKYHATQGPLAGYLTDRTLGNLRGHPPALVISWGEPEPKSHPIVGWIGQNYDPVDDPRRDNFPLQLRVLRNSPLQRRLRESAATGSPAR
jgi:hypothetical protein